MSARQPSAVKPATYLRKLRSRAMMLLCFLFITLTCVVLLARDSAPVVIYRLMTDGGVVALWLLAGVGWGSALLWRWKDFQNTESWIEATPLLGAVTSAALGLGAMSLLVLGLGLWGWLNDVTAILVMIVGILILAARCLHRGLKSISPLAAAWFSEAAGWDLLWLAAAPMLAVSLVGAIAPTGILWKADEPQPYDVLGYHLQVPREWFEAGRIVALHHNVYSFFPFNVESHYLLAMHLYRDPWAAAYACQLMHVAFIALSALAVFALIRPRAGSAAASIAGLLVATTPWMAQLACVAYDEGGFLLFGSLAVGWMSISIRGPEVKRGAAILAGAFAGLACGSKLTAVPEVLMATPVIVLLLSLSRELTAAHRKKMVVAAILFGLAGCVTFAPWLARNLPWAHNPVFPEAMKLFGSGPFAPEQVARWSAAHAPPIAEQPIAARLSAALHQILLSWQFGYVLIPAAVVSMAMTWRNRSALLFSLLLLSLTLTWLFATHLQGRFFVLGIPLAGLLLGQVRWGRLAPVVAGVAVLIGLINSACVVREINRYLVGGPGSVLGVGLADAHLMGMEKFSPGAELLEQLPPESTLVLIGEARAFWYPIPMTRLRYRTVFDVLAKPGEDEIQAWMGADPLPANARLLIDPEELLRLHKTYINIPSPPRRVLELAPRDQSGRAMSFLLDPKSIGP